MKEDSASWYEQVRMPAPRSHGARPRLRVRYADCGGAPSRKRKGLRTDRSRVMTDHPAALI